MAETPSMLLPITVKVLPVAGVMEIVAANEAETLHRRKTPTARH
jgi:hypothetical protein